MELITYRLTLDASKPGIQRTIQGIETGDRMSREIRVSLANGKDTYDLPLDSVTAAMYVTAPSATSPSINPCEIDGNEIVYKILPSDISEAGMVTMQIKVVGVVSAGASEVFVSPRFALEVWKSDVSDSTAQQSPVFTALETALAQARLAYNSTIESVVLDDDDLFIVTYKDGHTYTSTVIQDALAQLKDIDTYVKRAESAATTAVASSAEALASKNAAKTSEDNAKTYEANAKTYNDNSRDYSASALASKKDAAISESNAASYSVSASASASSALSSKTDAKASEDAALISKNSAAQSAVNANADAARAKSYADSAQGIDTMAESYTHGGTGQRPGEDTDNAWYYMKQAQSAAAGGLLPVGNCTFEQLMALTNVPIGHMYHVTTAFTTNNKFEDFDRLGPEEYPAGTNVYMKSDGLWCAMVGQEDARYTIYDNTTSGLASDHVQGAIDELALGKADKSNTYAKSEVYTKAEVDDKDSELNESITDYFHMSEAEAKALTDEQIKALLGNKKHGIIEVIDKPYVADDVLSLDEILSRKESGTLKSTDVPSAIAFLSSLIVSNGAGFHNSIYRGKFLGNAVTAQQYSAISSGTFDDLYIGDYWTIGGVNYRIAAFDYYMNSGNTAPSKHHVVIVPDTCLYDAQMNASNVTTGGYMGSAMYTANLAQAKTTIKAAFSGHVLNHRIYLVNAVTNGRSSGGAWADSEVDLMNEQMVYGGAIFSPTSDGSNVPANYRVEKSQLPLFALEPSRISNRTNYWLRDVVTAAAFTFVADTSVANSSGASNPRGVRPAFCIY